ncbi:MAG: hypothetical protein GXO62_04545 [Epsilonproteobacteria bacterium]|nr:hypothetical protein [Campylobacterota bacterium]
MTYIPLSENTLALIETLKPKNKSLDEWIREILEEIKEKNEFKNLQLKKMQELWEDDTVWDKYEV